MKLNRSTGLAAIVCAGLVLGACTTLGTGSGSTLAGDQPVSFAWQSKDGGVTGTMTATLSSGPVYTGPYLEITSTTQAPDFYPMWRGWSRYWSDWQFGIDANRTTYTGKVVANLEGPGAQRMRCRFDLTDPLAGMSGGGQGQCQVAGGSTIDATFPKA
jgi:hypothetical protein